MPPFVYFKARSGAPDSVIDHLLADLSLDPLSRSRAPNTETTKFLRRPETALMYVI